MCEKFISVNVSTNLRMCEKFISVNVSTNLRMCEKFISVSTSVLMRFFSDSDSSSLDKSRVPIMSWSDARQAFVKIFTSIGDLNSTHSNV